MKHIRIIGIAAASLAVAISCKKANLVIGGEFAEKAHFEIAARDTLKMPFTVSNMMGTGLDSTKVRCSNAEFNTSCVYTPGTGIKGNVVMIAPEVIESTDDVTVILRLVSKDGRSAQAEAIVSIKK